MISVRVGTVKRLQVTERISFCRQDVIFNVHPESYKNIKYNRRTHSQQRHIDKILSDSGRSDPYFITQIGADSKHLPFYEVFESIHRR